MFLFSMNIILFLFDTHFAPYLHGSLNKVFPIASNIQRVLRKVSDPFSQISQAKRSCTMKFNARQIHDASLLLDDELRKKRRNP